MARGKKHAADDRLDLGKILQQAKHRWLRPAEVWEIIRNYTTVGLCLEVANMPPSGLLFLYDRKVVRCFRRDGHKWKKPKGGKAVKESHERLKVQGVGWLHCYYAHGEENENFQKRRYSMVEHDLSHIVMVHYRELESIRTSFNHVNDTEEVVLYSNETEELAPTPEMLNFISSSSNPSDFQMHSQAIDAASLNTAQASEYKNAKSAYNHQSSLQLQPLLELRHMAEKIDAEFSDAYYAMAYSKLDAKNQQINSEAKHRWLCAAEICEILQNHENYLISSKPTNMPPGGSLFLFNRKVLRFFRKDGHNWRKKKDGKTVSEANEKLKFGNDHVLHCYYAHGEENKNFQRRVYSMLYEGLSHIVLVHYREVQGNTENFNHVRETEVVVPYSKEIEMKNSVSLSFNPSDYQMLLQATDMTILSSAQASEFEDAGSVDGYQEKLSTIPWVDGSDSLKSLGPLFMDSDKQNDLQFHLPNTNTLSKRNDNIEGRADHPSAIKPMLEGSFGDLEKNSSFYQWMNDALEDLDEPKKQFNYGAFWDTLESENEIDTSSVALKVHLDSYMLLPSLSHDQLFSIVDISPTWVYAGSRVEVSITGNFLKSQHAESCKWSCMFQEVEVPAEVVADGVLHCYTPIHKAGRVPFYVTCSNRLACSEVREFEYRVAPTQDGDSMGKTDMKSFDPTNGLNELSKNRLGVLHDEPQISFSSGACWDAGGSEMQVGGSDCGAYVVRHMQSYGNEWWHEFDSQEQRMDLATELVRNRFNLARKDVLADMNASTAGKKTTLEARELKQSILRPCKQQFAVENQRPKCLNQ